MADRMTRPSPPMSLAMGDNMPAYEAVANMAPGYGDALSARDAYQSGRGALAEFQQGNYGRGALSAAQSVLGGLGALPLVPNMAGVFISARGAHGIPDALLKMGKAQDAAKSGIDPVKTYQETGWFQGPDGHWRMEISDEQATLTPDDLSGQGPVRGAYAIKHPELYSAYPEMRKVTYEAAPPGVDMGDYRGRYDPETNRITVKSHYDPETALHELQHAIQEAEEFPPNSRGSSAEAAGSLAEYWDNIGEIEARDVARRKRFGNKTNPALLERFLAKKTIADMALGVGSGK